MKQAYLPSSVCRYDACASRSEGLAGSVITLTHPAVIALIHPAVITLIPPAVLQSDACFEAMQIDWPVIRQQAIHRGVVMTRVAVRDFDHNDQVCIVGSSGASHSLHGAHLAPASIVAMH